MASSSVPATPHVGLLYFSYFTQDISSELRVSSRFGPMLIGVFLNVMLYGVSGQFMFLYYHRYKSDRPWFRYFALYLLVAETANVVCDIGLIYEPLIVRYGNIYSLLSNSSAQTSQVAISTPIQIFIAWRVRIMTGSLILPAMISIFAIVSFCGGTATTVVVSLHPDYASFPHFHGEVVTWLASSAACDIFLTSSLVYSLYTRKTNFAGTDSYLNRAIRLTVQTGLITAAAALLDLLVYLNFVWDFALSKLYTNALIST
ncbi:hypothetical protein B0H10DRAFT_1822359 [Mycena sp. CBHHK59/15]|nr:hypothetical protein B0H10DRAFT_1822359 [Mycena sp. CBHHK59/15]